MRIKREVTDSQILTALLGYQQAHGGASSNLRKLGQELGIAVSWLQHRLGNLKDQGLVTQTENRHYRVADPASNAEAQQHMLCWQRLVAALTERGYHQFHPETLAATMPDLRSVSGPEDAPEFRHSSL